MAGLRIVAEGRVSVVTVNRPDVLNALNTALLEELLATLEDLGSDPTCGVIVVTGAGDRAFIAGADIKEMDGKTPLEARDYSELGQEIAHKLETMRKPTIAAVNGYALGGGCEIALACDVRLASENARFGQPEINLGIIPGWGGTQRLARATNIGYAKELILTGRMVDAAEALERGLVQHVYPERRADAAGDGAGPADGIEEPGGALLREGVHEPCAARRHRRQPRARGGSLLADVLDRRRPRGTARVRREAQADVHRQVMQPAYEAGGEG